MIKILQKNFKKIIGDLKRINKLITTLKENSKRLRKQFSKQEK